MTKKHNRFLLIVLVILLSLIFPLPNVKAGHQAEDQWQLPEYIPGLVDSDPSSFPIFIDDGTGRVHVFHSQPVRERVSVVYSRWIKDVGWLEAVDIVISPIEQARLTGVFVDNQGIYNLFFWGGNDQEAAIYLSQAPNGSVGDTRAWSTPLLIGPNAIAPTTSKTIYSGVGEIVSVYSGNIHGNGLYSIRSNDNGATWTQPFGIFFSDNDRQWPNALQLYQTNNNQVYAVWSLADETGNGQRIYFSGYDWSLDQWSRPIILADAIGFEADTANIIEYDNSLIVIYHNGFPTTRWMVRSFDKGKTWTPAIRLFEQVGSNGAAALVIDSSQTLHMVFGNRTGLQIHGLWHSTFSEGTWRLPEAIVSGTKIEMGPNGEEGFDPSFAQALVIQGNRLLVFWRQDPGANPKHIWYSYRDLNTPSLPTVVGPLKFFNPIDGDVSVDPATPTIAPITPVPNSNLIDDPETESQGIKPNTLIFFGILPATIIILVFFILVERVRR